MRYSAVAILVACLLIMTSPAVSAQADSTEYGIKTAAASESTNQAGTHPDFTVDFELNTEAGDVLPETTREISIELPPGLLGNPNAVPKCSAAQLVGTDTLDKTNKTGCPQDSQVGITEALVSKGFNKQLPVNEPIYDMQSPGGNTVARFGFIADTYPTFINVHLRPGDYAPIATVEGTASLVPLLSANTTLWGVPADESHDNQRITPYEALNNGGVPETPNGRRPSGLVPAPFMVNPTRCGVAREVKISATSYNDRSSQASASLPPVTGCGALDFSPTIVFTPTSRSADSPSGMGVQLFLPQEGLRQPNLLAEAHLKKAVVTLPEGLTLNPAAASGLGACTEAQIGLVSESPIRFDVENPTCPDSSKVGTAKISTPLLPEPIEGSLYVASQSDNPFHTLLSGYLVAQGQGVTIKLAGRFDIDPLTHRITAIFDENPQAPFETFTLRFKEGARGVLVTPAACGSYGIESKLSPWSALDPANPTAAETATSIGTFGIDSGPSGGPCPSGQFGPTLEAGTTNPLAGQFSPLAVHLTRSDGTQRLSGANITLPPGLTGKLAGIPYCPEAAIAAAQARSGLGQGAIELANPSCPAASRLGKVIAGAGAGPTPFFVETGNAYLAGPYKGAPLSFVIVTPALAGPFDLGAVVVRIALHVDHETAQVSAVSDPLPTILQGIPLDLRDVRVFMDRPHFALNPTSCDEMKFGAILTSEGGKRASSSSRFQVGGCRGLGFKPRLYTRLFGKTNRGAHPRFRAVLKANRDDANIGYAQITLPPSEFIENAHFNTICTRVQFAANSCPPGSIYGHARAFTPLLAQPLEGPVYLRSSSHELPDLVVALKGQIEFDAVAHVDSVNGGVRATFESVPDAPVSKFVVNMKGGKKGLFVNSRNICRGNPRASAKFTAHNGRRRTLHPRLAASCGRD